MTCENDGWLDVPVDQAGLPVRTVNALRAIGVKTLAEASELGRINLLRTPGLSTIGVAGLFDIIDQRKAKYQPQPAFPGPYPSMTLRDWFAGQALVGIINACAMDARQNGERTEEMFARKAYSIADAMLEARK